MSDTWMKIGANHSKMKRWAILEWKKGRTKKVSITWTKTDPRGRDDRPPCPVPHPSWFRRPWGNDVNDASRCVDKPRCVCSRHLGPNFSFAWSLACLSIYMQNAEQSGEILSEILFYFFAHRKDLVWGIVAGFWGPHEIESWNFQYQKNSAEEKYF